MEKQIKPTEVVLLTEEQIEVLEPVIKKEVKFLTDNLSSGHLMVLNPFILKLTEIQSLRNLEYKNTTPEEKEQSIAEYKSAMEELKEVKKAAVKTREVIKRPIDEMGKMIKSVENGALAIIDGIISDIDTTFKEYRDEEEERLRIAREKREAAAKKKTEELEAKNRAQQELLEKTSIINQLKYEVPSKDEKQVQEAVSNWTLERVRALKQDLEQVSFEKALKHVDQKGLLNEEEKAICKEVFDSRYKAFIPLLNNRIELLELQEAERFRKQREEEAKIPEEIKQVPIAPEQAVPVPTPVSINRSSENYIQILNTNLGQIRKDTEVMASDLETEFRNNPSLLTEDDLKVLRKMKGAVALFDKVINYLNE